MKEFGKDFLLAFLQNFLTAGRAFGVMGLLLIYYLVRGRRRLRAEPGQLFVVLGVFFAYHFVISLSACPIERYYRPAMPLLSVFAGAGLLCMLRDIGSRRVAVALVALLGLAAVAWSLREPIRAHRREQVVAGRWLREHDPRYKGFVVSSYSQTVLYSGMRYLDAEMGRTRLARLMNLPEAPKYMMLERHAERDYPRLLEFLADYQWKLLRTFPERKIRIWRNPRWISDSVRLPRIAAPGMEAGFAAVGDRWHRVELRGEFRDPVVVAGVTGSPHVEPTTVRVRAVTPRSFEVRLQEWDCQDGVHRREAVYYLVVERGVRRLPDGRLVQAGTTEVASCHPDWTHVGFPRAFGRVPLVITQVASAREPSAVVTRMRAVGPRGFDLTLQEEEAADGRHAQETVGWVALEPGLYRFGEWRWEAAVPREGVDTAGRTFATSFGPLTMRVQEEFSLDREMWHLEERVGYLLLGRTAACIARLQSCRGPDTARLAVLSVPPGDGPGK